MSQSLVTDLTIDPLVTSGDELAVILNRLHAALVSCHKGSARPANLAAGGMWAKSGVGANDVEWYLYDGTNDVLAFKWESGSLTVAGVDLAQYYTKTEIDGTVTAINAAIALKANSADVYAKTVTYTKTEIDAAIASAAPAISNAAKKIENTNGWNITPNGTTLEFSYNGTKVATIDSSGAIKAISDITAYTTV